MPFQLNTVLCYTRPVGRVHWPCRPSKRLIFVPDTQSDSLARRSYGKAADVWSLGVLVCCLLTGQFPFVGECEADLKWVAKKGQYWTPPGLSTDARDLLSRMLAVDARKRATAQQVVRTRLG